MSYASKNAIMAKGDTPARPVRSATPAETGVVLSRPWQALPLVLALAVWFCGCAGDPEPDPNADPGDRAPAWIDSPRPIALTTDPPISAVAQSPVSPEDAEAQARQTLADLWPVRIHDALRNYLIDRSTLAITPREGLLLQAWEHIAALPADAPVSLDETSHDLEANMWQALVSVPFAKMLAALQDTIRWANSEEPTEVPVLESAAAVALRQALGRPAVEPAR